jgi:uncharacterized protein (DUF885 family)
MTEMSDQPPGQDALRERLMFLADTLNTRWVTQRSADDSARPAFVVEVPAREVDATITAMREAAAALSGASSPGSGERERERLSKELDRMVDARMALGNDLEAKLIQMERERDEAREQQQIYRQLWHVAEERAGAAEAKLAQPHPMLTQALANLKALEAEMSDRTFCSCENCARTKCWVDKLGTVLADLQEAK